ncbi:hypothetical protein B0F88_102315 [Methylobacter tundripaludum]|uniref:Uncharacterized protein n=1 Tax=Methylobacter tundripaludum TaxID=173365 RepID=A0A2S6H7E1_9GAMM|nr:hypothetical protein B0F88_102315 [Methylobacter tundripaludum]
MPLLAGSIIIPCVEDLTVFHNTYLLSFLGENHENNNP